MTETVLLPVPLPPIVEATLAPDFRIVRLWDPPADMDAIAPELRLALTGLPILADGVVCRIDEPFLARFPRLEIVASVGVGYDNVDVKAAAVRGIVVANTPDVLTDETADTAFGLLLCAVRQLPQADRYLRSGRWPERAFPLSASLRDRTMGIVGLGRIGKAIARRAEAFGLKIIYHGRSRQGDAPYPFFASLEEMARACDILMVATPGGPDTRNLIDARILDALGPDGILVNIARGTVVDEDALIAALRERRILTAGLDVFANEPNVPEELMAIEHAVLLPHVGTATEATRNAMCLLAIENIRSFAAGRGPVTPVAETPWTTRPHTAN